MSGRMGWRGIFVSASLTACAVTAPAAITDEEIFRDFRFNLKSPGARSLAMGGAFMALSDDATAALTNPAGLTHLTRPEIFMEFRLDHGGDSEIHQSPFSGIDVTASTRSDPILSPSFASWAYPWERAVVGLSRLELTRQQNATANLYDAVVQQGQILYGTVEVAGRGSIETEVSVWNLSGAIQVGERVGIGATLAWGILDMEARVQNTIDDTTGILYPTTGLRTFYVTEIDDHDSDLAFNLGVHWHPVEPLSFAAVYRGGMKFSVGERIIDEEALLPFTTFFLTFPLTLSDALGGSTIATTLNTPDTWGAGAAWRASNRFTVTLDWLRIQYSDLLEGFQGGLNALTLGDFDARFAAEDAEEVRLGVEYVLLVGRSTPVALRAGLFTDRSSRVFADFARTKLPNGDVLPSGQSSLSDNGTFPDRDTELHVTLGGGIVVERWFQIDAAASFSDVGDEYLLSIIARF